MPRSSAFPFVLVLALLTACDSPGPSGLDPAIRSLLTGPLAVGEAESFVGEFARQITVHGGSTGAEYLYVASNVSVVGVQSTALTIQGEGVSSGPAASLGPAEPAAIGRRLDAHPLGAAEDSEFHDRLRRREVRLVAELVGGLPGGGLSLLRGVATAAEVPTVGEIVELNVNAQAACTNPVWQQGRVEAVSAQAIVVADTRNPPGLTRADYEQIARDFDERVYPLSEATFGAPARQIGPARTTIFYTVAVNELRPPGGETGLIGGFFFVRDLFPQVGGGGFQGCPASNQREMFYMRAADPQGTFGTPTTVENVRTRTLATVMHEFQHLINASRRLYVHGTGNLEEVWLNEALSHIAEELLFYQESGLAPRQNITLQDVTATQARLNAVNRFQVQNLARYLLYLEDPPAHTPIDPADGLEVRGASWAFLRYLADHYAPDDAAFFFDLVNTNRQGVGNLQDRLGMELEAFRGTMRRWDVANYADDLVPNLDALLTQPSWNFRSLLPALTEDESFPLAPERLGPAAAVSVSVRAGSAAFIRFGVPAGQRAVLTTTSGGASPPETARATLVRVR